MKNAFVAFIPTLFILGLGALTAASASASGGPELASDLSALGAGCQLEVPECVLDRKMERKAAKSQLKQCEAENEQRLEAGKRIAFTLGLSGAIQGGPKVESQSIVVAIDRESGQIEIGRDAPDGGIRLEDGLGAPMEFSMRAMGGTSIKSDPYALKISMKGEAVPAGAAFPADCYKKLLNAVATIELDRLIQLAEKREAREDIRVVAAPLRLQVK